MTVDEDDGERMSRLDESCTWYRLRVLVFTGHPEFQSGACDM